MTSTRTSELPFEILQSGLSQEGSRVVLTVFSDFHNRDSIHPLIKKSLFLGVLRS